MRFAGGGGGWVVSWSRGRRTGGLALGGLWDEEVEKGGLRAHCFWRSVSGTRRHPKCDPRQKLALFKRVGMRHRAKILQPFRKCDTRREKTGKASVNHRNRRKSAFKPRPETRTANCMSFACERWKESRQKRQ